MRLRQSVRQQWELLREKRPVDAAVEFITVVLISSLPLWGLVIIHLLGMKGMPSSLWGEAINVVGQSWRPADLLVYVTTLLAPLTYLLYQHSRAGKQMPLIWVFLVGLPMLQFACALIFAMDRLDRISNEELVKWLALALYVVMNVFWYSGLVLQRRLQDVLREDHEERAENILRGLREDA